MRGCFTSHFAIRRQENDEVRSLLFHIRGKTTAKKTFKLRLKILHLMLELFRQYNFWILQKFIKHSVQKIKRHTQNALQKIKLKKLLSLSLDRASSQIYKIIQSQNNNVWRVINYPKKCKIGPNYVGFQQINNSLFNFSLKKNISHLGNV